MEAEILQDIINKTKDKLDETDTELNILDLLQTYDNHIKKHKISIDLKTKVYVELLKWSRENLESQHNSEDNCSSNEMLNSDLDFEIMQKQSRSINEKDIKEQKLRYEREEMHNLSEIEIREAYNPASKRMVLPKLTFDLPLNNSTHSCTNKDSKPPIAKKNRSKSKEKIRESSEKPLKEGGSLTRINTEGNGGKLTPKFKDSSRI